MAKRLLRYHVLIEGEYNMPVYSCVIHILRDGEIPVSPLRLTIETGEQTIQTIRFDYQVIELGQVSPNEILQTGQAGLLPLLPFTKGGATRSIVETVFEELTESGKTNLLSVAQTLASLAFGRENKTDDQEWLIRRYKQMFDIVKDTPIYKEMTQDARKEGIEEGLKEGLQQAVMDIIAARFPRLIRLATGILSTIDSPSVLRSLIIEMSTAKTAREAKEHLLAIVEEAEEQGEE